MGELNWIIIIYALGLATIVVEMFIPGLVVGVCGVLATVGAIVYAYYSGHTTAGIVLTIVTVAIAPLMVFLWLKIMDRFFTLRAVSGGEGVVPAREPELLGKEGKAASALRPSGVAMIDGRRHAVVTRGELIESGARVRVIDVMGNRVIVKKK